MAAEGGSETKEKFCWKKHWLLLFYLKYVEQEAEDIFALLILSLRGLICQRINSGTWLILPNLRDPLKTINLRMWGFQCAGVETQPVGVTAT